MWCVWLIQSHLQIVNTAKMVHNKKIVAEKKKSSLPTTLQLISWIKWLNNAAMWCE